MNQTAGPVIRHAGEADWAAIAALLAENALPLEGAREHLADYLVADLDGLVAGSAGLECYGDTALLRSCVVDARYRGNGIGTMLTQCTIELARQRGIYRLILLTTTAENFFACRGFTRVPRDSAPEALKASAELRGACPASAVTMQLLL